MAQKGGKPSIQNGIDIGTSFVKFVQLAARNGEFSFQAFDVIKIEERSDGHKKAIEAIARKFSVKEAAISVSGPATVVRHIELPRMTEEELKSSMKFEAEKYIPFSVKDVVIDCQIVDSTAKGKMGVLLAAAKKEALTERIGLAETAGIAVTLVDCDAFALTNAFLFNYPEIPDTGNCALVNLGDKLTTISILKGKTLHFTRELQAGGADFAKSIAQKLGVDMKKASEIREDPKDRAKEIIEITRPILVHLAAEIRLSLSYYENQLGISVETMYASGGLSSFPGLVEVIKESIGMDCALWDPTRRLDKSAIQAAALDRVRNRIAVAVGLAMRDPYDKN